MYSGWDGSDWTGLEELLPPVPQHLMLWGSRVEVAGDQVIVGTQDDDNDSGIAHVFRRHPVTKGWTLVQTLDPNGGQVHFTRSVASNGLQAAISRATSVVEVYRRADAATTVCAGDGSGLACPCGNPGAPGEGCANSLGAGARLAAAGGSSVSEDELVLGAEGLPPQPALLFAGDALIGGGALRRFQGIGRARSPRPAGWARPGHGSCAAGARVRYARTATHHGRSSS